MQQPSDSRPAADQPLRIVIAATPKTGNVWVKHLLSAAYRLRIVEISRVDAETLKGLAGRWVAHQHDSPTSDLLRHLKRHNVVVMTVFRHPCDVLVSLKSYLHCLPDAREREPGAAAMLDDGDAFGAHTLDYVRTEFAVRIQLSLLWAKTGAIVVRYEDLKRDPLSVLRGLAPRLGPVPERRLMAATIMNDFNRQRAKHAGARHHFRQGRSGGWRQVLPAEIVEAFRTIRPYPALFSAMGYSLDESEEAPPTGAAPAVDPFHGAVTFDNGVPLCDFVIQLYTIIIPDAFDRWPEPAQTEGSGSYFEWLNEAAVRDDRRETSAPLITNLMHAIYESRADLKSVFPDVFGRHRLSFANWILIHGREEYALDLAFLAPLMESIARADAIA